MVKCAFSLDDFCWDYRNILEYLDELAKYFSEFKASLFTIPCHKNIDYLSNRKDWWLSLPNYLEFIPHGWSHVNHEFAELEYFDCRDKISLGLMEFIETGLPLVRGFKAPNWRYNNNLVKVLQEKNMWIATYTDGHHKSRAQKIDIPTCPWNWDIKQKDIPEAEIILAHGHVLSQSGPGGYIGEAMDNIKQLPKNTEFVFLSEYMNEKIEKKSDVAKDATVVAVEVISTNDESPKEKKKREEAEADAWRAEREKIVQNRADKWNSEISVIITGHSDQRLFMQACVDSVYDIGGVVLTYDRPVNFQDTFPKPEIFTKVDQFFMKHSTREIPGPTVPQFWNFKHGADIIMGSKSKYVFIIGADSILERPQGIGKIKEMLGDGDIISCSSQRGGHKAKYCNTKSFLMKKESFKALMDCLEDMCVPWDYQYGNLETRFGEGIDRLKLKEVITPDQPGHDQFAYHYDKQGRVCNRGTWGNVLGYRHLGGEKKKRREMKQIPIEREYHDLDYIGHGERKILLNYWDTGKQEYLEQWWNI